jgi:hypothetical protein
MKVSYVEDREGTAAREEARRKKENGVFVISEPHELLFSNGTRVLEYLDEYFSSVPRFFFIGSTMLFVCAL